MASPRVRVLIAEDDALVASVVRDRLERVGYSVVGHALNGADAVDMTRKMRPDVVLMNIDMPVMDGIAACRKIKDTCPTPVAVLTAYESPDLLLRACEAGAGAYLVKPARSQALAEALSFAMARFRACS